MDVDIPEESVAQSSSASSKKLFVVVDDAHPFDLDGYISNYTGRTAVDRLIHIISVCPPLAPEAFQLAVQQIHQSRDPSLYQQVLSAYEQVVAAAAGENPLPSSMELAPLDTRWADETMTKNQAERSKLEVELKTYTNNMIKESIRMGHRELGDFYRSIGEYPTSLKHYTKSREFCTTSPHVLEMCLSVLELLIEQRNYSHLPTYVFKADAALDAASAAASNAKDAEGSSSAAAPLLNKKKAVSEDRERVQSKLDFASALSHFATGNYQKAAYGFLKLGPAKDFGDWMGRLVAPGDIAIYGVLCALASLPRSALKTNILENSTFGVYVEQEPYVRELVEAYLGSNFKTVLELLNRYSSRHALDIYLAPHVVELTNLIRNWAVVLYFQPFASIKLDRMSAAFGWTVEEVEEQVVQLIQSGQIQGRVDSQNKILYAKQTDYRAELFARAIKAGRDIQSTNRKVLLRMRLQQADLAIKAPKGFGGQIAELLQD
ncbi:26S proteasome subunit RPN7-domain-containing protein [Roridomyces roridus]|uniref:26S proteasome subunit RPN7-domain-containing protein n=1 Tax=Roridomyces roridus TaxID=1738132 RepID=A0AAD7BRB1_9AGAR|nr:26S proteasome subunit RPN7-domain-containing protein [Roridomyces roridus]